MLENEYLRAMTAAELAWVSSIVRDLTDGRLTWSSEQLVAIADTLEQAP